MCSMLQARIQLQRSSFLLHYLTFLGFSRGNSMYSIEWCITDFSVCLGFGTELLCLSLQKKSLHKEKYLFVQNFQLQPISFLYNTPGFSFQTSPRTEFIFTAFYLSPHRPWYMTQLRSTSFPEYQFRTAALAVETRTLETKIGQMIWGWKLIFWHSQLISTIIYPSGCCHLRNVPSLYLLYGHAIVNNPNAEVDLSHMLDIIGLILISFLKTYTYILYL